MDAVVGESRGKDRGRGSDVLALEKSWDGGWFEQVRGQGGLGGGVDYHVHSEGGSLGPLGCVHRLPNPFWVLRGEPRPAVACPSGPLLSVAADFTSDGFDCDSIDNGATRELCPAMDIGDTFLQCVWSSW